MDRRTTLRRERDTELEEMAENAMSRADEAFGKWETHEQVCAERYRRLDENMTRFGETQERTHKILVSVLLAVAGTLAVVLLNLLVAGAD